MIAELTQPKDGRIWPQDLDLDLERVDRPFVASARRIVVKLGTRVLTNPDGSLATTHIGSLVATTAAMSRSGKEVVLVSSGALGLGYRMLGLDSPPTRQHLRRACAAVGQARLMSLYQHSFALQGLICAQVLVSESAFDDRGRNLELRKTLDNLLRSGVIPILNENDAVAGQTLTSVTGETRPVFGDNDRLAALVCSAMEADLLLLLTDVPGVFDKDPTRNPDARLLPCLYGGEDLAGCTGPAPNENGVASRGGMRTKVQAAMISADSGSQAIIASGKDPGTLSHVLAGEALGTWFPPRGRLQARHRWIAFATAPRGVLHLDDGAVDALRSRGASLLAAGVTAVEGQFEGGDVVELRGPDGDLVGRAMIPKSRDQVELWRRGGAPHSGAATGALIRRNFIVLARDAPQTA
ncbi:MAG: glutamate 5-kinase [Deltaproteobacteria bacterium]|nr:glutamate 5-kinase [Deltaproteobacteria bacterium]